MRYVGPGPAWTGTRPTSSPPTSPGQRGSSIAQIPKISLAATAVRLIRPARNQPEWLPDVSVAAIANRRSGRPDKEGADSPLAPITGQSVIAAAEHAGGLLASPPLTDPAPPNGTCGSAMANTRTAKELPESRVSSSGTSGLC